MISVTAIAVEEVKRILSKHPNAGPNLGLRIGVKGGGCSGLSYALGFETQKENDHIFEFEGLKVLVDPKSYLYLENTTLDFQDTLEGRGFKFVNPDAQKTCGCGESFSA